MQWLIDLILPLLKTYVDEKIAAIPPFPTGTVIAWWGLWVDIPDGWAACEGTDGRPDLRAKFLRGAGGGAPIMADSGSNTHTHGIGGGLASGKTKNSTGDNIPLAHGIWWIMKIDE